MTVSVTSRASFVQETSTTTGTGTYDLAGAVAGFQGFVAGNGDGEVVRYSVTDGTDWEVCEGTITDAATDTLSRDTVLESSNSGAAVDWGAGTKTISQVLTPEEVPYTVDSATVLIKESVPVTLSGGEYDIDLTNYQDGDKLVIEGYLRSSASAQSDSLMAYLNGDTSSDDGDYHWERTIFYDDGQDANGEGDTAQVAGVAAGNSPSNSYAFVKMEMMAYAESGLLKSFSATYDIYEANNWGVVGRFFTTSSYTAAITSVTLSTDNPGTDDLSGTLHAYIEKEGVLPTTGYTQSIVLDVGDETTALTTGTAKKTFRMPYAFTLTDVRASVTTAPTGDSIEVDINEGGVSILSTVLSIDATEKTSTTAATPAVISDTALADDAEITIDIDQIGSSVAGAGLKVTLIGNR